LISIRERIQNHSSNNANSTLSSAESKVRFTSLVYQYFFIFIIYYNYKFIFLSLKYENKTGNTISVSAMEVINQPTTTIAKGFCNSEPVHVLQIIGINHITEVNAVISTGLSLTIAP
jgi:hypothetical protein